MTGPMNTSCRRGSPTTSLPVVSTSASRKLVDHVARDIGASTRRCISGPTARMPSARRPTPRQPDPRFAATKAGFLPPISASTGRIACAEAAWRRIVMPDRVRAGEGEAVDAADGRTSASPVCRPAVDEVEHAVRQAARDQRFDDQAAGQAGRVARLEHHGVAGDQRGRHHPERQRDREIERRDHSEHAVRAQDDAALFGRTTRPAVPRGSRRCAPSRRNNGG